MRVIHLRFISPLEWCSDSPLSGQGSFRDPRRLYRSFEAPSTQTGTATKTRDILDLVTLSFHETDSNQRGCSFWMRKMMFYEF